MENLLAEFGMRIAERGIMYQFNPLKILQSQFDLATCD